MVKLRDLIDSGHTVEGDLRREISQNIKRLQEINVVRDFGGYAVQIISPPGGGGKVGAAAMHFERTARRDDRPEREPEELRLRHEADEARLRGVTVAALRLGHVRVLRPSVLGEPGNRLGDNRLDALAAERARSRHSLSARPLVRFRNPRESLHHLSSLGMTDCPLEAAS